MSARQKLSLASRWVSANICRHSSCGYTVIRIRDRSTVTEPPDSSSGSALLSEGTTRSRLPSVSSTRVPSPVTAKSSASSASSSSRNWTRS